MEGYHYSDDIGLGLDVENTPYYGVKLTAEQADIVSSKEMKFYNTDGKTLFEVRDKDGNKTGEWMFFVVFV